VRRPVTGRRFEEVSAVVGVGKAGIFLLGMAREARAADTLGAGLEALVSERSHCRLPVGKA